MKLDKDLIREILLQVEANPDPVGSVELVFPDRSQEAIAYHVEKLNEAGFLHVREATSYSIYDWQAEQLTYAGHEFLDTIRDGEAWRFTKEAAKRAGVSSLKALFEIAKSYAKHKLIEHGMRLP